MQFLNSTFNISSYFKRVNFILNQSHLHGNFPKIYHVSRRVTVIQNLTNSCLRINYNNSCWRIIFDQTYYCDSTTLPTTLPSPNSQRQPPPSSYNYPQDGHSSKFG
eukprot:TRINITY_DN30137_c0_g1_i1.p1 TRINITY_DN30137_c0_g1~~TRINITY_DN30137_c0_g1_i1.p1  ORF type:complete len:106 (-),score=19.45 TRINITY_DN30137_c0_g1_i1:161-478(-)